MRNNIPVLKKVLIPVSMLWGLLPTAIEAQTVKPFGRLPDGREIHLYTLKSAGGLQADITDYGGTVVRLLAPDRDGKLGDVVLGFEAIELYAKKSPYFGALIGRVGNRIAGGRFSLDG